MELHEVVCSKFGASHLVMRVVFSAAVFFFNVFVLHLSVCTAFIIGLCAVKQLSQHVMI
jgi:hypothetical protein